MGCTPWTCKPCACPASRPKKEPSVSNRDTISLMGEEILHARSWNRAWITAAAGQCSSLHSQVQGELTSYRGIDIRLAYWLQGKPAEGTTFTVLLISYWELGTWIKYVGRSVMCIGSRRSKDWSTRDGQRQENSHLEWPDHIPTMIKLDMPDLSWLNFVVQSVMSDSLQPH